MATEDKQRRAEELYLASTEAIVRHAVNLVVTLFEISPQVRALSARGLDKEMVMGDCRKSTLRIVQTEWYRSLIAQRAADGPEEEALAYFDEVFHDGLLRELAPKEDEPRSTLMLGIGIAAAAKALADVDSVFSTGSKQVELEVLTAFQDIPTSNSGPAISHAEARSSGCLLVLLAPALFGFLRLLA